MVKRVMTMGSFEKILHGKEISFRYAGGSSIMSGREFHPYHEIILFMGENALLFSDAVNMPIEPGTVILIPKETYHQLNILGSADSYVRCVLHFYDLPELTPLIEKTMVQLSLMPLSSSMQGLFQRLIHFAQEEHLEQIEDAVLRSVLTLMLLELQNRNLPRTEVRSVNPVVSECISYITKNISGDLAVDTIARQLNVSRSGLSHIFREEMNISLHKYILKKRLVLAHRMISQGQSAMAAAEECGFHEYSNFYRQYKKIYGRTPSSRNDQANTPGELL